MWSGTRAGFFTQVAQGNFPVDITVTPTENQSIFTNNPLCQSYVCMAPGINIFGATAAAAPPAPFNPVQLVRNFQTPMNHERQSFTLTFCQAVGIKHIFRRIDGTLAQFRRCS